MCFLPGLFSIIVYILFYVLVILFVSIVLLFFFLDME